MTLDSNWTGMQGTNVTDISLKAKNTDWLCMRHASVGNFQISALYGSPFELPISVKLALDDGSILVIDNGLL